MPRIPLPTPDVMTPEQRKVYDSIVKGPRGTLVGPLRAALHRPELADKWQQFGELLRYRTSLPPEISEIAILVTARRWLSQVEWHMHAIAADQCRHRRRRDRRRSSSSAGRRRPAPRRSRSTTMPLN